MAGLRRIALLLCIVASITLSAQSHQTDELIYAEGSAPFPSAHASTVVELKGGALMSAWFGGTKERANDVAIWGSHEVSGKWSAPVELVREKNIACWNPVLFHTKDGALWLYYKFGPMPSGWSAGRMVSHDEGKTWSAPEHLPAGLLGPIRAKPLVLADGTIVSGSSVEAYDTWAAWIERSKDGGKTWIKYGPITVPRDVDAAETPAADPPAGSPGLEAEDKGPRKYEGIIQPSVVSLGGHHLRLYARSRTLASKIALADSNDDGVTWTQARFIDLPNNNSGIDAVTLKDGRVVMIFNNTTKGRTPLNLAVSRDGEHFKVFSTLEDTVGQYSYPAIIQMAAGDLEMTYTWHRTSIKHVHVPLGEVPQP